MSRAVVTQSGKVKLQNIPIGSPGPWDILVEIECCGLSLGTESYQIAQSAAEPGILGYAPVARILEVGERAAEQFAVGERVTYFAPNRPAGFQQRCGGYQSPAILTVGPDRDLLAANDYVVTVPPDLSSDAAAFAGISAVSYFGAELSESLAGQKVLIIGQGIIGLFATQHFALRGASIGVADLHDQRLQAAAICGADWQVNTSASQLVETTRSHWPAGADIVVDTTASHQVVEASMPALKPGGTFVFLGFYKGHDFNLGALHGHVFQGCFPWTLQGRLVAASLKLMHHGLLRPKELITHRIPVDHVSDAYATATRHPEQCIGMLLDWRD